MFEVRLVYILYNYGFFYYFIFQVDVKMIFFICNRKIYCIYLVFFILYNKFNKRNCKLLLVFFQNIIDLWIEVVWRYCWSREYWIGLGVDWVSRCN